jgi:hypothetical protein
VVPRAWNRIVVPEPLNNSEKTARCCVRRSGVSAAQCYEKTERAYGHLVELLGKARRAELIRMDSIRDDGFVQHSKLCWADADHFLKKMQEQAGLIFRLDRQQGQSRRLAVMCEAAGMAPQLYR